VKKYYLSFGRFKPGQPEFKLLLQKVKKQIMKMNRDIGREEYDMSFCD